MTTASLERTPLEHPPLAQARFNMIEQQIRPWDVLDTDILALLAVVRREDFVPSAHRALAFVDMEIPLIGTAEDALLTGRCMLAPKVEARLLQDLQIQPHDSVLEIGAGSGHMAALLAHRAHRVLSLEIDPQLTQMARANLRRAGITNADVRQADGSQDLSSEGRFDVILLSGSVAEVPPALVAQLKPGGRLGAIVGGEPMMRATFVAHSAEGRSTMAQPWDTVAPRLQGFREPSRFTF